MKLLKQTIALVTLVCLVGCSSLPQITIASSDPTTQVFEKKLEHYKKQRNRGKNLFWSGFIVLGSASVIGLVVPEVGRRSQYERVSYKASRAVYWSSIGTGIVGLGLGIAGYIIYQRGTDKFNETLRLWIQYNNIISISSQQDASYTSYAGQSGVFIGLSENEGRPVRFVINKRMGSLMSLTSGSLEQEVKYE